MMTDTRDPLEDDPPVPSGGCGECERGWRTVKPAFAHHEAIKAGEEGTSAYAQRFASAVNTVYPCRICRPGAFFRWANGHLDPEHERTDCVDCTTSTRSKSRTKTSGSWTPPPPGDEHERRDLA